MDELDSNTLNMKHYLLALLIPALLACTDDTSGIVDIEDLRGNWVETTNETDTLYFATIFEYKEILFLKRDELYRAGPYEYQLLPNDRISIHWTLASTMTFDEYYFQLTGDQLRIGNFYDSPSGAILTFRKIE